MHPSSLAGAECERNTAVGSVDAILPLHPSQAGILQVTCILGSGLTFFVSRGSSSEGDYGGYTGF